MDIIDKIKIASKWQQARDSYRGLFKVTNDLSGYEKQMATYQEIIKEIANERKLTITQSVSRIATAVAKDSDMQAIRVLSAGYELINGNDFTV